MKKSIIKLVKAAVVVWALLLLFSVALFGTVGVIETIKSLV